MHKLLNFRRKLFFSVLLLMAFVGASYASIVELDVVGKIESIYRDRVTLRVIKILGSDTADLPIAEGSWVSFDLPKHQGKNRNRRTNVGYGSIVKAELVGNVTTEYEVSELGTSADEKSSEGAPVLLWTSQSVMKVKRPDDYLTEEEKEARKGRKRGRRKKKEEKPKEPVKIWTQEETVRGVVNLREKDKKLYLKEERMGRRDKGLDVLDDEWYEKLKEFAGQKVVVHGTTHRTSVSSGTVEIQNLLKIYSK